MTGSEKTVVPGIHAPEGVNGISEVEKPGSDTMTDLEAALAFLSRKVKRCYENV